jgi:transcriptional regulator with XRE-family HTH domain
MAQPSDIGPRVGLSHAEIAERLGITRVRVGQIERQALAKLYQLALDAGLYEFFDAPLSTELCSYCKSAPARPNRRMCAPCARKAVEANRRMRVRRTRVAA